MRRTVLKVIFVLVLSCVLVVASWEPNNFGLSLGASAPGQFEDNCIGWAGKYCWEAPGTTLSSGLQETRSPIATVTMLFIMLGLLILLNRHLTYGRTRGLITGFTGEQRVFYVRRGLATRRAKNKL